MTIQFRDKSDKFVYTKLGEKIDAKAIFAYLGKSIPVCYITGATLDVVTAPVDLNVDNILPSNMAYISKRFLDPSNPLTMILNFVTVKHAMTSGETVEVVMLVPHYFNKRVIEHAKELLASYNDFEGIQHDVDMTYNLWDKLTFDGLKGMFEVRIHKDNVTLMVDYQLATNYFMRRTEQRMKTVAGLQLVK